jgi:ribosomal protein S18 acetylase RimI-like enzyme
MCLIVVHPAWRRQGIGRELLRRAESYLNERGATQIRFGQSRLHDPFYLGIHGGARPSGVLESDQHMAPFLAACGYRPLEASTVLQRDLTTNRDPTNFRLIGLRRQTELLVTEPAAPATYAWYCHFGNMESMQFALSLKKTGKQIASVTVIGLDHYVRSWGERAIGLVDLHVDEQFRGQGYGTTLLIESLRRLRSEMNITLAELHVDEQHSVGQKAVRNAGFIQIEKATVYSRIQ